MSDSPAKKLNFSVADKENVSVAVPIVGIPELAEEPTKKTETTLSVAPTIKSEEAHEPLLQENPQRFVLFPIQNHEVGVPGRVASRVKWFSQHTLT
jgi:ribonucleoside-diphosphate reductase subunit M2